MHKVRIVEELGRHRLVCSVELRPVVERHIAQVSGNVALEQLVGLYAQGIPVLCELLGALGLCLVGKVRGIALVKGVVGQADDHFLLVKGNALKLVRGVAIADLVIFLIVVAVEKLKYQIVLGLAHLEYCRVCNGKRSVALAVGVVVNHHAAHHPGLLVRLVHA